MRKQIILIGGLLFLVGCGATSSNIAGGGMPQDFGGASGFSGYAHPGGGGTMTPAHAAATAGDQKPSDQYRMGLRTSNNSSYSGR